MARAPAASAEGLHVATPAASATLVQLAIAAPALVNVTVPVGVPLAPLMVAVNVTFCPEVDGFTDEASVAVEVSDFTWPDVALTMRDETSTASKSEPFRTSSSCSCVLFQPAFGAPDTYHDEPLSARMIP